MPQFDTPILFLIFNRPEPTKRVFEAIRAIRPSRLFIAADGARHHKRGEDQICRETRTIVSSIDWACEVQTLLREENLGCGLAVSGAIQWFFDHVEEGIILEDDCLPHPDFFPYCATLLERYRHEPSISTIAGTHFLPALLPHAQSHYVSKYFQMWGWASWRRTWARYDYYLKSQTEDEWKEVFRRRHPNIVEAGFWIEIYKSLMAGGIDTWDFQVCYSAWRDNQNHIMPGRNLISNIGYGPDATHTAFASPMSDLPVHELAIQNGDRISLTPDPSLDSIIFFLRFLDSLNHTCWIEQVLNRDQSLSDARIELTKRDRDLRMLKAEIHTVRRQLLAATKALTQVQRPFEVRTTFVERLKHILHNPAIRQKRNRASLDA
jgi:hypothetical protein